MDIITISGFLVNLAALIGVAVKMSMTFERRMTLMETRMNGHKDLGAEQLKNSQAQLAELALTRKECEAREKQRLEDHEVRLRGVETKAHGHDS